MTMFIEYGSPAKWTFENFSISFLVGFFLIYHLGLLQTKKQS